MSQQSNVKILWFCLVATYPAIAQIQHGSIGVVYFTDEKIVMAADSRAIEGGLKFNDECKVAALGSQIVMVNTGVTRYTSRSPTVPSWNSMDEAHRAYEHVIARGGGTGDVAEDLAKSLTDRFKALEAANPRILADAAENGVLTTAYLGGLGSNGRLELFRINILFQPNNINEPIGWRKLAVECIYGHFCALGRTDVFLEFAGKTTERARNEAETWAPESGSKSQDLDIQRTIRLVDLTIQFYKGDDVGGAIDALQIDRSGSIRWYARKSNCPEE
jgi:hypothetical protein